MKSELVMTRHGLALVSHSEDEAPRAVAQYDAMQLVEELGPLGLLLWAGLNQLRDIHAQLSQLNQRAESAVQHDGSMDQLLESLEPVLSSVPQLRPLLEQLKKED